MPPTPPTVDHDQLSLSPIFEVETIQNRIKELGKEIDEYYQKEGIKEITVVCIMKGAIHFFSDLVRCLKHTEAHHSFVGMHSGYIGDTKRHISPTIYTPTIDPTDKHILIVEDIVDTGRTLKKLIDLFESQRPASVRTVALLSKPMKRDPIVKREPEYIGFEIADIFAIGYGLDYQGRYRNLPYISCLSLGKITIDRSLKG